MKVLDEAFQNYLNHMDNRQFPICFPNSRKFEDWQAMESLSHTKPRAFPCRDCTKEFYNNMKVEGKCFQSGIEGIERVFARD